MKSVLPELTPGHCNKDRGHNWKRDTVTLLRRHECLILQMKEPRMMTEMTRDDRDDERRVLELRWSSFLERSCDSRLQWR